ncbi:MAG: chemotaxis protein CheW [Rickettsiales bacterium]
MTKETPSSKYPDADAKKYIRAVIGAQAFALETFDVEDVLLPQRYTPIPLSPFAVLGMINLRGRIVTVLSLRRLLGMDDPGDGASCRHIVFRRDAELYSFIVDEVSDIIDLSPADIRKPPENLSPEWKDLTVGVRPALKELTVILDPEKIFATL